MRACNATPCAGKTTFIKYLLGRDYPGSHIGPEPTTDRFVVVYHGLEERRWVLGALVDRRRLAAAGVVDKEDQGGMGLLCCSKRCRHAMPWPCHCHCPTYGCSAVTVLTVCFSVC